MSSPTVPPTPTGGNDGGSTAVGAGSAQNTAGISIVTFVTALITAIAIFGAQMLVFILLRNRIARI
jgi:hypothetical protein